MASKVIVQDDMYLKLVRPAYEYAQQVMQYKEDMLANHDSFDGCAGLEEVSSFAEGGKWSFLPRFLALPQMREGEFTDEKKNLRG